MKIRIFCIVFALLLSVTPLVSSVKTSENIADKVFRLHIIANSDSMDDQRLKLLVRNEILNKTSALFSGIKDKETAISEAKNNIDLFNETALTVIRQNGYNYNVKVLVDNEFFNTREYNSFTLPAGKYDCLKIILGEGKGKNFWCVLYPCVCVNSCSKDMDDVLNEEEIKLIKSKKYRVRFKAIEIYEKLKSKL